MDQDEEPHQVEEAEGAAGRRTSSSDGRRKSSALHQSRQRVERARSTATSSSSPGAPSPGGLRGYSGSWEAGAVSGGTHGIRARGTSGA